MEYRRLGRSGLKVSELSVGTVTFGNESDQAAATRIVDKAIEAGINFFDTADCYVNGASETILGHALKGRRRDAVIASKFVIPMGPGPNDSGMSRSHIMRAIEDSLKRLQTDYIDVYYVHRVDIQTPLDEMLRTLDDLVRSGKVRYIACSNYEAWRLMEALWISHSNRLEGFVAHQPQYSLLVRDIEDEIVPACLAKGVGIVVWAPLAGGWLTGKYKPGQMKLEGTRSATGLSVSRFFTPKHDEVLAELLGVARELGRPAGQVALRWVLDRPGITSAIVGARTAEQAHDSFLAGGWKLPADAMSRLDAVSAQPIRFPRSSEDKFYEKRDGAVKMPSLAQPR